MIETDRRLKNAEKIFGINPLHNQTLNTKPDAKNVHE
jgi:hypothetical protein